MRRKIAFSVISALCVSIILSSEIKGGEDSLFKYWQRPVSLQTEKRKNLYPEACGECHKEQYMGWKSSLHSRAVGPGLLGQLKPYKDPEFAESCYFCHAPMMEQSEVRMQGKSAKDKHIKNQYFDDRLKLTGVSCAVCHIREGRVYGPPKREVRSKKSKVRSKKQSSHSGFIEKDFFQKAEFCAACHQLEEGYELNGKLLVNTYREWKESIYGQNNITCQNCHMPDRQHLWRGIHDKERVKNSVSIETIQSQDSVKLVITNSGVGHLFPTYVTPLIVINGFLLDKANRMVSNSEREAFIGRRVTIDLDKELFDTRILPQKSFEFDYPLEAHSQDKRVVFEVWVYPDEFYSRFYKAMLKGMNKGVNRAALEKALKTAEGSGYMIFSSR